MHTKVTCLLPVYNGAEFLRKSIESVLEQSFRDFQLLIIDDGSTDESVSIIQSFNDPRITLLKNEKNSGLIHTLNRGMDYINSEYMIRMDADDICENNRFKCLVDFLDQHPEIWVTGSQIRYFGNQHGVSSLPLSMDQIRNTLFFRNSIAHPSVIIRIKKIKQLGIRYEKEFLHAEDYRLWTRIINAGGKIANVPDILLKYRIEGQNISLRNFGNSFGVSKLIWKDYFLENGLELSEKDLEMHGIITGLLPITKEVQDDFFGYLTVLYQWVKESPKAEKVIRKKVFDDRLDKLFFHLCDNDPGFVKRFWMFRKRIKMNELRYWLKKRKGRSIE